ncbi:MAG: DUF1559 family PulG-like putative transporter [Planctomycetota bacterium]|jgi:prepilin-type N-terminal cleavage/methylation domain-containing protein
MKTGRGFTLIEILVVIIIVLALAAILLPVLAMVREHARAAECKSNMKQIGTALLMYRDDYLATNKEWNPPWLNTLLADQLKDKECLLCPSDDSRGAQGGKPDGLCDKQFTTINERPHPSSYMYEFNMAVELKDVNNDNNWAWVGYLQPGPDPHVAVNLDGNSSMSVWGEVKTWQLKRGCVWGTPPERHIYSPTMFPIIRCFWHADDPDADDHLHIHNLSYMCNFFRSGATWEETSD